MDVHHASRWFTLVRRSARHYRSRDSSYKSLYLQVEVARIGIRITVTMTFSTTHGVPLATGCRQVIRKPVRARIDVRAR
ncbi:hypothetical protein M431DRAFT_490653 [Trichoderma harzianum CBS 226.95]|uniref:Uncharacterized protein n=1 Tax=Trichoderma harzianum CBS 226.95 TaxID=983964 RepID=A0A2T4APS7_TRIHA|nr:hypothetical protein M431DRAFT_490653 [Trichoderma harzianum CBS 226.95]PTB59030.1 hypothetical protein M431DRAFT_490653 [Trichoderma harzianum CBS 226.95]